MCVPAVPLLVGMAVLGSTAAVIGQIQSAKAQSKALNQANEVTQREIDRATNAEINDRLRDARREQGRIAVAAGEAGLSLESGGIETLLMDTWQQASLGNDRSLANRESRKLSAAAQAQAQMPSRPTALGAGLQIASAGASTFASASAAFGKR